MRKIYILLGAVLIVKLILILSFGNTGWEPDSYQHFNEALTVYKDFPNNLSIGIGVWSKLLFTYPMGLIALVFGAGSLYALQIVNLFIFSAISFLVYKISKIIFQNENIALTQAALSSVSLILFISSISALTEPIFTLTLVLGYYVTLKKRYRLAGLLFGLSVLGRIEGLFFVGIYNLWLACKFRSKILLIFKTGISPINIVLTTYILSIIPTIVWNFLGYLQTGRILYIFDNGYPTDSEAIYGTGSWIYYFTRMGTQEGVISLLLFISTLLFIKNFKTLKDRSEISLSLIFAIGFFCTQVITWRFGLFGSAGLMRYFISVLPFMIIISGIALQNISILSLLHPTGYKLRRESLLFASIILVQITITLLHFVGIGPIDSKWIKLEHSEFREAGTWIEENVSKDTYLGSERPEVIYYANRDLQNSTIFPANDFRNSKAGIYAWSASWGEQVAGVSFSAISETGSLLTQFGDEVFMFEIE